MLWPPDDGIRSILTWAYPQSNLCHLYHRHWSGLLTWWVGLVSCNWRPWTGQSQQGDLFLKQNCCGFGAATVLPRPDRWPRSSGLGVRDRVLAEWGWCLGIVRLNASYDSFYFLHEINRRWICRVSTLDEIMTVPNQVRTEPYPIRKSIQHTRVCCWERRTPESPLEPRFPWQQS